jgi:hypothetical protein
LKRQYREILDPRFFFGNNFCSPVHGLKPFRIQIRIREDLWLHRPRAMPHRAELRLRGMRHSAEFRLPAMRHSTESTIIREYICELEIKLDNILG